MHLYNMKLQNKILLTNLLVLAVAISAFLMISTQMFQSYYVKETQENLEKQQGLIAQSLDTLFDSTQDYIRLIAADFRLSESMRQLKQDKNTFNYPISKVQVSSIMAEIMSNYIYPVTHIVGGAIVVDGEVIYSGYNIRSDYLLQAVPQGFLQNVSQTQRPVWSKLSKLNFTYGESKNVLMVGKSIIHKSTGYYLGECILFLDEAVIRSSYSSPQYLNSNIYLTDFDYTIISCANQENIGQNLNSVLKNNQFSSQSVAAQNVAYFETEQDKTAYSIFSYPKMNWRVVITASYEPAIEKSNHTSIMILIAGLGCIGIYFLSSSMIAYTLVKPINNIANSMRKAGNGDLSVRETKHYRGEMQAIATNFNELMDKIQILIHEVYVQQKLHRQNEFRILQAQINPHFLYNTIETIISFITLDMKKEAVAASMSLAEFYKLSLSKGKSIITVSEEIKLTLNYIKIQKLRYGDYFNYEIDVRDLDTCSIPKLTLQPLVENAIYHGIKETNHLGKIMITGFVKDGCAIIEVFDNGIGIAPEKIPQLLQENRSQSGTSFGLANIDQRIKYLYGQNFGLNIESEQNKYTKVIVTLPIQQSEVSI